MPPVPSSPQPDAPASEAPPIEPTPGRVKHFVVDTNVLLHNPRSLYLFAEHEVVIPFAVLSEIDKFKKGNDDVARNAREVARQLDQLRKKGKLSEGVPWNGHGGTVRVALADEERPSALREDSPDHRIIGVAWALQQQGHRAILVSKDINVRIKADALGIPSEDFEAQKVDIDRLYNGYVELDVGGDLIDQLYEEKQLELSAIDDYLVCDHEAGDGPSDTAADADPPGRKLEIAGNQFIQFRNALDDSHTGLARRLADTDYLIPIHGPRKPTFGIMHRNVQQLMALDLLLDDEIKLVTLLGGAGTGKTLLALASGMTKVFTEQRYEKLLVARPIMPMGRDIGYLPGDKDEKLSAWMQPIFDNLEYLMSTRGNGVQHADSKPTEARIKEMVGSGQLVLEPLTYIRGRSIPHQFIIIDEAQNLTPHEIKTIVSRVGESTKIVLTGDVNQIDHPYLDGSSNGLSYAVENLKGSPQVGHVTLARSERSELASLAADRL
ncbi:MAG: PhoH family protein [Planctomycetota bacterium]